MKHINEDWDDNKPWAHRDGWDEAWFEGVGLMDWLERTTALAYEIKNARRGAYVEEGGEEIEELIEYIKDLNRNLTSIVTQMENKAYDGDEDFEDEDLNETAAKSKEIESFANRWNIGRTNMKLYNGRYRDFFKDMVSKFLRALNNELGTDYKWLNLPRAVRSDISLRLGEEWDYHQDDMRS